MDASSAVAVATDRQPHRALILRVTWVVLAVVVGGLFVGGLTACHSTLKHSAVHARRECAKAAAHTWFRLVRSAASGDCF
jgi:hypothetical protein